MTVELSQQIFIARYYPLIGDFLLNLTPILSHFDLADVTSIFWLSAPVLWIGVIPLLKFKSKRKNFSVRGWWAGAATTAPFDQIEIYLSKYPGYCSFRIYMVMRVYLQNPMRSSITNRQTEDITREASKLVVYDAIYSM